MNLLYPLAAVSALPVLLCARKCKRPVRQILLSGGAGFCGLGLVNLLAGYTGVSIALNFGTAFVCGVLGLPGVILLLFVRPFIM